MDSFILYFVGSIVCPSNRIRDQTELTEHIYLLFKATTVDPMHYFLQKLPSILDSGIVDLPIRFDYLPSYWSL